MLSSGGAGGAGGGPSQALTPAEVAHQVSMAASQQVIWSSMRAVGFRAPSAKELFVSQQIDPCANRGIFGQQVDLDLLCVAASDPDPTVSLRRR